MHKKTLELDIFRKNFSNEIDMKLLCSRTLVPSADVVSLLLRELTGCSEAVRQSQYAA